VRHALKVLLLSCARRKQHDRQQHTPIQRTPAVQHTQLCGHSSMRAGPRPHARAQHNTARTRYANQPGHEAAPCKLVACIATKAATPKHRVCWLLLAGLGGGAGAGGKGVARCSPRSNRITLSSHEGRGAGRWLTSGGAYAGLLEALLTVKAAGFDAPSHTPPSKSVGSDDTNSSPNAPSRTRIVRITPAAVPGDYIRTRTPPNR
jgi:hypothetical protein